jgi:hypothetical protein
MQFVLANRLLDRAGGTEVHLVTLGEQLQRLGHQVVLYSPVLGPFADHARDRGLTVCDNPSELPRACDVTFSQDTLVAYEIAGHYPGALSLFRICNDIFDFGLPPQLHGVVDLVVVLSDRYERLARASAVAAPVLRLRVPIDVDRLVPIGTIRERPRRAVVLGNYDARFQLVRDVWGREGVTVEHLGGGQQTHDVAAAVADVDIVVGKSRAALDAMACGRAVYVLDIFGGDGWVTPDRYAAFEADNFAGQATDRVIDAAALSADLSGYRQEMGIVNRDLVLQHHTARDHVVALLNAIAERSPQGRSSAPLQELSRLAALQWSWQQTALELRSQLDAKLAAAGRQDNVAQPVGRHVLVGPERYFLGAGPAPSWHAPEHHPGFGAFRWSGPGRRASIALPIMFDRAVDLSVGVFAAISPETLDAAEVWGNGQRLAHEVERCPNGTVVIRAGAAPAEGHGVERLDLTIVAETRRPIDLGLNQDTRLLGIAIGWVDVAPRGAGPGAESSAAEGAPQS